MSKGDTLELVGSPNTSRRRQSIDSWTYRFYNGKKTQLNFKEGVLVYKGPPTKPRISAEEQDILNQPRPPKTKVPPRHRTRRLTDKQLRDVLKKEVERRTPKK